VFGERQFWGMGRFCIRKYLLKNYGIAVAVFVFEWEQAETVGCCHISKKKQKSI
jgi:hypothetical protein